MPTLRGPGSSSGRDICPDMARGTCRLCLLPNETERRGHLGPNEEQPVICKAPRKGLHGMPGGGKHVPHCCTVSFSQGSF